MYRTDKLKLHMENTGSTRKQTVAVYTRYLYAVVWLLYLYDLNIYASTTDTCTYILTSVPVWFEFQV